MSGFHVDRTRHIAEFQIYNERVINRGRQTRHFEILNQKFSNVMYDIISDMNCVCMYPTNFDNP